MNQNPDAGWVPSGADKVRPILTWPDELLLKQSEEVTFPLGSEVVQLVDDMFATMRADGGIGLSAIQVGVALKIVTVLGSRMNNDLDEVYLNPVIQQLVGTPELMREGCLSFPNVLVTVPRYREIVVEFNDMDGRSHTKAVSGLKAQVLQHEIDHLNGVLFLEKTSVAGKQKIRTHMKQLERMADKMHKSIGDMIYGPPSKP